MSIIHRRGDAGYEAARGAMWNARRPDRFPDIVVEAETIDDVVAAVREARRTGMKIAIRSGGHSWAGTFLRDGGMLIDLSRMNRFTVNAEARTAVIEPGLRGTDLNRALAAYELFFPSGHCMTVGLGGFLLQGGFGWNSRLWGPACAHVTAVDVVTADGEMLHASARENADLFWAARGAGPGFFGVVTKFHLALQPRPKAMMRSDYLYPIEALDDVLGWMRDMLPALDRRMEPLVFLRRDLFDHPGPGLLVTGPVMADSREQGIEVLRPLETCPALGRALRREVDIVTTFDDLMQGGEDLLYPRGRRYAADNMWTSAPADALLPGMGRIAETLPSAPSHMMWMGWGALDLPDMAFSMQDDLYVALYSVWQDPRQDGAMQSWVTDRMRELEPLASGIQLADENLAARPFRFMDTAKLARLETLRSRYDPSGLFHDFMARPPA